MYFLRRGKNMDVWTSKKKLATGLFGKASFQERIKKACAYAGITLRYLARCLNMSEQNLASRLKTGKMSFEEQQEISEILHCQFIATLTFDYGTVIYGDEGITYMIEDALIHAHINKSDVARAMDKTRQAISDKLKKGRLSDEEIEEYANIMGCKYYNAFVFDEKISF